MAWIPSRKQFNNDRKEGFRPVVVLCLTHKKKVALFFSKKYKLWQLPQGGIENNETLKRAFFRELSEEINPNTHSFVTSFTYIGTNKVYFPEKTQASRGLKTDKGKKVSMKGKKYYFVAAELSKKHFNLLQSEFDRASWKTYKEAIKTSFAIYQKGKKRITINAINKLQRAKLLS